MIHQVSSWLQLRRLGSNLLQVLGLLACAIFTPTHANAGDTWQEEVLLHDGHTVVVERAVQRGGRAEIGQAGAYIEQRLSFSVPETGKTYSWSDSYSPELGMANFLLVALDVVDGTPYIVADPMGCQSYNKWGRPNPPYVIFKWQENSWQRIPMADLPDLVRSANLIHSMPDVEMRRLGVRRATADQIQSLNAKDQPQYRSILREPMTSEQINSMCDELINYKGHWIDPRNPFARKYIDEKQN